MQEVIGVEQRSLFQKVLVTFIFSLFISTVELIRRSICAAGLFYSVSDC